MGCLVMDASAYAKENYIYRKRANWVKLDKLSSKQMAGETLKHPCLDISVDQMTAMLMSLKMNKGQVFKKGIKTSEIFSDVEAQKYAPLIVKALNEAAPNQVVNIAVVHRRPYFVMRNDYISVINIFVADDGVHFNFSKLFARLSSDYQQASKIDQSIRDAKGLRVDLATSPGQVLLADADEIVLDPHHDFGIATATMIPSIATDGADEDTLKTEKNDTAQNAKLTGKKAKSNVTSANVVASTPENSSKPASEDAVSRLKKLEELKKSNLITAAEYQKKRQEILNGL